MAGREAAAPLEKSPPTGSRAAGVDPGPSRGAGSEEQTFTLGQSSIPTFAPGCSCFALAQDLTKEQFRIG